MTHWRRHGYFALAASKSLGGLAALMRAPIFRQSDWVHAGATEPSDTQSSKVPVALACTIVAFMLVAVSATSAAAATHPVASFLVPLRGSHGWPIKIETRGRKQVTLIVQGGDTELFDPRVQRGGPGTVSSATYTVRARVTNQGFNADFGSLGHISVRFSGPPVLGRGRHPGRCHALEDFGHVVGTLRFTGEERFTRIATHRTFAIRYVHCRPSPARASLPSASAQASQEKATLLAAIKRGSGRTLVFAALGEEIGAGSERKVLPALFVSAVSRERRGAVKIEKTELRVGYRGAFGLTEPGINPTSARVALPSPFAGEASFLEELGAVPSWTGDFLVSFLGEEDVPLTGPGFETVFCRSASESAFLSCTQPLEEAESAGTRR
jgi:hypothetical protein